MRKLKLASSNFSGASRIGVRLRISETSRPTTHHDPVYVEEGVVHYCVANMPGAVSRTSTQALCNATLPYTREIANLGLDAFIARSEGRSSALNMRDGKILHQGVHAAFPDL